MKKRLNKQWLSLSLGALVVLPMAAGATLVTDGNFTAAGSPGAYTTYNTGQTMGGWTVTAGSVDLIGSYWQAPPSGGNSVDMAGNTSGTIQQTVSGLVVNQQYALSFYLSGNPDGGPAVKQLGVGLSISGTSFSYAIGVNTRGSMDYTLETAYFTASSASEVLQFQDQSSGVGVYNPTGQPGTPWGAVIGGVSLTPVPEPTTMIAGALLLLPFGVGALRGCRKMTHTLRGTYLG